MCAKAIDDRSSWHWEKNRNADHMGRPNLFPFGSTCIWRRYSISAPSGHDQILVSLVSCDLVVEGFRLRTTPEEHSNRWNEEARKGHRWQQLSRHGSIGMQVIWPRKHFSLRPNLNSVLVLTSPPTLNKSDKGKLCWSCGTGKSTSSLGYKQQKNIQTHYMINVWNGH